MTHRWQPDAVDAQREADAAATMERMTGLDAEVNCRQCSGAHLPGEEHCGVCHGHHKPGDTGKCEQIRRTELERVAENARRWRKTRRMVARRRSRYA
jgi:hypothetical protein